GPVDLGGDREIGVCVLIRLGTVGEGGERFTIGLLVTVLPIDGLAVGGRLDRLDVVGAILLELVGIEDLVVRLGRDLVGLIDLVGLGPAVGVIGFGRFVVGLGRDLVVGLIGLVGVVADRRSGHGGGRHHCGPPVRTGVVGRGVGGDG